MAQSLGGNDNGGSLQTLLHLLERGIGSCLEAVVAMTPESLGALLDLAAKAATVERLERQRVAELPGDAASAEVLANVLSNTHVQMVGDVPLKALDNGGTMAELNLVLKKLSPCEAGLVAHYLRDRDNRLKTVVVNSKLSLTEDMCHAEMVDVTEMEILSTEVMLIAAVIFANATAINSLNLSNNNIGPDGMATLANAISSMAAIRLLNISVNKCFGNYYRAKCAYC